MDGQPDRIEQIADLLEGRTGGLVSWAEGRVVLADVAASSFRDLSAGTEDVIRRLVPGGLVARRNNTFAVAALAEKVMKPEHWMTNAQWASALVEGWWIDQLLARGGAEVIRSETSAMALFARQLPWRRYQLGLMAQRFNVDPQVFFPLGATPDRAWSVLQLIATELSSGVDLGSALSPTWNLYQPRPLDGFTAELHWLAETLAVYLGTLVMANNAGTSWGVAGNRRSIVVHLRAGGDARVLDEAYTLIGGVLGRKNQPFDQLCRLWVPELQARRPDEEEIRMPHDEQPSREGPASADIELVDGEWSNGGDDVVGFSIGECEFGEFDWTVFVNAAEFVRDDPLEDRLRADIDRALRSVSGVQDVEEEDREVWLVAGDCSGRDLAVALDSALRRLEGDLRRYYDEDH